MSMTSIKSGKISEKTSQTHPCDCSSSSCTLYDSVARVPIEGTAYLINSIINNQFGQLDDAARNTAQQTIVKVTTHVVRKCSKSHHMQPDKSKSFNINMIQPYITYVATGAVATLIKINTTNKLPPLTLLTELQDALIRSMTSTCKCCCDVSRQILLDWGITLDPTEVAPFPTTAEQLITFVISLRQSPLLQLCKTLCSCNNK